MALCWNASVPLYQELSKWNSGVPLEPVCYLKDLTAGVGILRGAEGCGHSCRAERSLLRAEPKILKANGGKVGIPGGFDACLGIGATVNNYGDTDNYGARLLESFNRS